MHKTLISAGIAILLCLMSGLPLGNSEVVDSSAFGFSSKNTAVVKAEPSAVYTALVEKIGSWWHPDHTFSGKSSNLSIETKAMGCFCEELPEGGGVRHMTIVYAEPGKSLRMSGALGPLQQEGVAGSLTWTMTEKEGATEIDLTYRVGGYHPQGLNGWAPAVDQVLASQLQRLKRFIETGQPE